MFVKYLIFIMVRVPVFLTDLSQFFSFPAGKFWDSTIQMDHDCFLSDSYLLTICIHLLIIFTII